MVAQALLEIANFHLSSSWKLKSAASGLQTRLGHQLITTLNFHGWFQRYVSSACLFHFKKDQDKVYLTRETQGRFRRWESSAICQASRVCGASRAGASRGGECCWNASSWSPPSSPSTTSHPHQLGHSRGCVGQDNIFPTPRASTLASGDADHKTNPILFRCSGGFSPFSSYVLSFICLISISCCVVYSLRLRHGDLSYCLLYSLSLGCHHSACYTIQRDIFLRFSVQCSALPHSIHTEIPPKCSIGGVLTSSKKYCFTMCLYWEKYSSWAGRRILQSADKTTQFYELVNY